MIELLVLNKFKWSDLMSFEDIQSRIQKNPGFEKKYNARGQKGDIVEVREKGFWTTSGVSPGYNKKVYALIIIDGIDIDNAKFLMESHIIIENNEKVLLKKRKYAIDIDNISLDENMKAELTYEKALSLLIDKTGGKVRFARSN